MKMRPSRPYKAMHMEVEEIVKEILEGRRIPCDEMNGNQYFVEGKRSEIDDEPSSPVATPYYFTQCLLVP